MENQNNSNIITFPSILGEPITHQNALAMIQKDVQTYQTFLTFPQEEQEKILSFIAGNRGLQITYDGFFKQIMDPYIYPERLVIMDIVLELENGSIVDVEMQKIGYAFAGERSDCYIADFIMRQYNRVKSAKGKSFTFRDMCPVYLIILMETSSREFKAVTPQYIHRKQTIYHSGAKLINLSNIVYISLDTFHTTVQNISTELDAWLTFLSSDNPQDILNLVAAFPEFKEYYQDIVDFRKHPKELIYMYSEALAILDYNTTQYMIDELQNELQEAQNHLQETRNNLQEAHQDLLQANNIISEKDSLFTSQTHQPTNYPIHLPFHR